MSGKDTEKFIMRHRIPRDPIEYDSQVRGSDQTHLPFVVGVMANLSGKPAEPLAPVRQREWLEIEFDTFEDRLKSLKPRVAFRVPNTVTGESDLSVDLTFESLDGFSPAAVARRLDPLNQILIDRGRLALLLTYVDGVDNAEAWISRLLADEHRMRALIAAPAKEQPGAGPAAGSTRHAPRSGEMESREQAFLDLLVRDARPKSAEFVVEHAVRIVAREALANRQLIADDAVSTIEAMIAAMDRVLTEQINKVIHHEDFKSLEASWRGLYHLVSRTEADPWLKIRILNISKVECAVAIRHYKGTMWQQSPIFKKLCLAPCSTPGADMCGCIVGDYYFDHSPPDMEILQGMAHAAAAAHAPFIAGAAPSVLDLDSWSDLPKLRDITVKLRGPDHAAWRSLRESEESRYICLAMPRFLARTPYSVRANPVEEFDFNEELEGGSHGDCCWANAAYAMAANITRAFKLYGWCVRIRGREDGGCVEGLACVPDTEGNDRRKAVGPIEAVHDNDRLEAVLDASGFAALCGPPGENWAMFQGAPSLWHPSEHAEEATLHSRLTGGLPYLFAACRFAHYVRAIASDKAFSRADDLARYVNKWIDGYVDPDPSAKETDRATRPLLAAHFEVVGTRSPGSLWCRLHLRPAYQLPVSAEMRMNLNVEVRIE